MIDIIENIILLKLHLHLNMNHKDKKLKFEKINVKNKYIKFIRITNQIHKSIK